MAGHGPAPKPAESLRRRNRAPGPTVVRPDGSLHGPDLSDSFDWPDATRAWWLTWRRSPQASVFTETDWSFLLDTAVLHAEFWLGDRTVAAELRLRAAKFGATPEDRARLRLEVGEPPVAEPRARLQPGRRQRLLKVVGEGDA